MSSSSTARLIIEGAIRLIKGPNYNLAPSELGAGFTGLNDLIASWSSDSILVPSVVTENFALIVGQGSYTIGAGGNFNTVRPTKILNGVFIRDSNDSDHPVAVVTRSRYQRIGKKSNTGRPVVLYYEPHYPLGIIYFDTEPTSTESVHFDSLKPITEITDLSATLTLPPEYKRALRFNLAMELAPEFGDIKLPDFVVTMADDSKGALERVNADPLEQVTFDNALLPTSHFGSNSFNSGY